MDSAIGQTLGAIEIICVDDGSTDGSRKILERYAANDPRIILLINEKNRGTLQARVRALLASRGDYILWLDCDDELLPEIAERAHGTAKGSDADVVLFPLEKVLADGTVESPVGWMLRVTPFSGTRSGSELIQLLAEGKISWNLWNKLWRGTIFRAVAHDLKPFAESRRMLVAEDLLLFWKAAQAASKYALCPTVGYRYVMEKNSTATEWANRALGRQFAFAVAAVAGKILGDESDPAMRWKAELVLRRGEKNVLDHIAALPIGEGRSAFLEYLSAFPPPQQEEILRAMERAHPQWHARTAAMASESH
jgi:glycosyltransferase involved in cell wall biosynthesis